MISNAQSLRKTVLFGFYGSLPTQRMDGKSLVSSALMFDVFILMSTVHRVDKVLTYVRKTDIITFSKNNRKLKNFFIIRKLY